MGFPIRFAIGLTLLITAVGQAADPVEVLPAVVLSAPAEPAIEPPRPAETKPAVHLRGRIEADALAVVQGLNNRLAVGDFLNATGFRRARLGAQGTFGDHLRWVSEFDFAGGTIRFADLYGGFGGLPIPGEFRVGHFLEPFNLEGQISSNDFPLMERSPANALNPARNWGVGFFGHTPGETATFAAGVFQAGSDRVGNSSTEGLNLAYTARGTWLAHAEGGSDPTNLFHIGAAVSRRSPPGNVIAFQPEAEVQSSLLQPGDSPLDPYIRGTTIATRSVWLANIEVAATRGPAWAMAEWRGAAIDQIAGGEVTVGGWYVSAGYFVTGEHRRYDRHRGIFDGVQVAEPVYREAAHAGGLGAWEVVGRVAFLDLTDGNVPPAADGTPAGADTWTFTVGVNWYLTDFARFMANYTRFRTRPPAGDWSAGDLYGVRFALFW